jgi:hypothetical protein
LRDDLGSLAFRTFDLLLLVLRNAHRDSETLVALFAKIFVKGHRRSFPDDANTIGLENLNTRLSAPGRLARNIHIPRESAEVRNSTASFITISGDGEVVGCLKTRGRLIRWLIGDRSFLRFAGQSHSLMALLSGRRSAGSPVPFRNKKPDGPHEMLSGDIDIPFAKNLHDPMNADS